MLAKYRRGKFGRYCVVASSPSCDWRGRRVMELIESFDPAATFFGVGGPQMQARRNFKNYGDVNLLLDKPFYPRYVHSYNPLDYTFLHLLESNLRIQVLLRSLRRSDFWAECQAQPALFVSVEGELVAYRLFGQVRQYYAQRQQFCPPTLLLAKTKKLLSRNYFKHIDFVCHYLPNPFASVMDFTYPGAFLGKEVVFNAYKRMLELDPRYSHMVEADQLFLKSREITLVMEEITFQRRRLFRERHAIADSACAIYVSAGDAEWEKRRNNSVVIAAVDKFVVAMEGAGKLSREQTVVLWRDKPALDFDQQLGLRCLNVDADSHFDAMSAADVGAVCNGDSVFEAAVAQLPVVILDPQGRYYSYISLLYNVWSAELNFAADGELLPETTGRHFPGAIADFWQQWYERPKERYRLAQRITPTLLSLLPRGADLPSSRSYELQSEVGRFLNPAMVFTNFLRETVAKWESQKNVQFLPFTAAKERLKLVYPAELV